MNSQPNASAHRNFRAVAQDRGTQRSGNVHGRIVGVIADRAALLTASRLRRPPDLLELRLDALRDDLDEIERVLPALPAPLILTARHPAEGGCHALSAAARRNLLRRFLPAAAWLDLELRSAAQMQPLITAVRQRKIGLILSWHDFHDTPAPAALHRALARAIALGADIFKIATRTDDPRQLSRLLAFVAEHQHTFPIAAMGMGARGAESRRRLLPFAPALSYVALGRPNALGQPTLRQLRRAHRAYTI